MSIFKETFRPFVREQLLLREQIMSAGSLGAGESFQRTKYFANSKAVVANGNRFGQPNYQIKDIVSGRTTEIFLPAGSFWTNTVSKQCTIRMSSGVDVKSGTFPKYRTEPVGADLAKLWILEGGVIGHTPKVTNIGGKKGFNKYGELKPSDNENISFNEPRSGIGGGTNTAYGSKSIRSQATTDDGYGIVPMPGIVDMDIRTTSAYGSLRVAKVQFECHNRAQLEVLEMLYMRPGYPILLEWGWTPYINIERSEDRSKVLRTYRETTFPFMDEFFDENSTIEDMNQIIIDNKESSGGNYDGFIGFCKNFEYKIKEDGGYSCTTEIIAMGECLDGLKGVKSSNEHAQSRYLENSTKTQENIGKARPDGTTYSRWDLDNPGYTKISELEFWLHSFRAGWATFNQLEVSNWYNNRYIQHQQDIIDTDDASKNVYGRFDYFHSVAPSFWGVDWIVEMVVKIWDEEHEHIGPVGSTNGANIEGTRKKNKHQLYAYTGVNTWTGLSKEEKLKLAHKWVASCGFLFMEGKTKYTSENSGVNDDPKTTDVDESINIKWNDVDIQKNYIRWDLFVEILNHFVVEKYQYDSEEPIIPKNFKNLINVLYTRDSNNSVNEYLTYPKFHTDQNNHFNDYNPDTSRYSDIGDLMDNMVDPQVGFAQSFFGSGPHNTVKMSSFPPSKKNYYFFANDFKKIKGNVPGCEEWETYPLRGNHDPGEYNPRNVGYIYLNCNMLLNVYNSVMGSLESRKKGSLFKYIQGVWDKVNHAFGDTHKFNIHADIENSNNIRIIDLDVETNKTATEVHELKIQSFDSAVRDFNFNTTIPDSLSSTIAIAAQSPDSINDLDKVSFAAFNSNTKNRFTKTKILTNPKDILEKQKEDYKTNLSKLSWYFDQVIEGNWLAEHEDRLGFEVNEARKIITSIEEVLCIINSKDPATGEFKKKMDTSKSALIPLNFNCQMDGISGIVIGNIFRLPKERLPRGYQADNIGFVVLKENQKVSSGQDWITNISGQLILLEENTETTRATRTNVTQTTTITAPTTGSNSTSNAVNNIPPPTGCIPNASGFCNPTKYDNNLKRITGGFPFRGFTGKSKRGTRVKTSHNYDEHTGIDMSMNVGTELQAMADCKIHWKGKMAGFGWTMIIEFTTPHPSGVQRVLYAHLSDYMGTKKGDTFKAGDIIALSGGEPGHPGAGNSQGPHLHFEVGTIEAFERYKDIGGTSKTYFQMGKQLKESVYRNGKIPGTNSNDEYTVQFPPTNVQGAGGNKCGSNGEKCSGKENRFSYLHDPELYIDYGKHSQCGNHNVIHNASGDIILANSINP